ncbi:FeoA family protein [Brevibacillus daliensis]|uniref:FeoA family protein n=1 Tax=Brevibacillus daliensis TaxID=2892995 RepID=UPI001E5EC102|nr:FeoA family protein [Brevibacillus daliensis]
MVLTDVKKGQKVQIVDITNVNALIRRRLIDLDVVEGTMVKIKRVLPFGGPFTLEAGGQLFGIRRREAKMIEVSY